MFHSWTSSPSVETIAWESVYKGIHSLQVEMESYLSIINSEKAVILEYGISQIPCAFQNINTREKNQLRNSQTTYKRYWELQFSLCSSNTKEQQN